MSDIDSIREILRALAEVRDGCFYSLYVELTHQIKRPLPKIEFRINQIANSNEAMLVVAVSGTQQDGVDVCWSLSLETNAGSFIITGVIELTDDQGAGEVFKRSAETTDIRQVAALVHAYASEVCAQGIWLEPKEDKRLIEENA